MSAAPVAVRQALKSRRQVAISNLLVFKTPPNEVERPEEATKASLYAL